MLGEKIGTEAAGVTGVTGTGRGGVIEVNMGRGRLGLKVRTWARDGAAGMVTRNCMGRGAIVRTGCGGGRTIIGRAGLCAATGPPANVMSASAALVIQLPQRIPEVAM